MTTAEESERQQARLRNLTVHAYQEYSFLDSVVSLRDYNERRPVELEKFARRVAIDHWLDPSYVHDIVFYDLARIVGLSERKYFIDQLQQRITPESVNIDLALVSERIGQLVQMGHTPTAILLPIELHQTVHTSWDPQWRALRFNPERLRIGGLDLRIFWSNMFMPFKRGYIVSNDLGTWTVRPSAQRRLQIQFRPLDQSTMEVTVQTIFNFQLTQFDSVKAFEIQNLPESRLDRS